LLVHTDRHSYLPRNLSGYLPRRIVPKNLISSRSKCPERFPVIP